jgi:glyoxylase-like metal-dependent hydrolase (beta-lactamase superfamily II)
LSQWYKIVICAPQHLAAHRRAELITFPVFYQLKPSEPITYPFEQQPGTRRGAGDRPGVHWLRMPLPFELNHINLWLLEEATAGPSSTPASTSTTSRRLGGRARRPAAPSRSRASSSPTATRTTSAWPAGSARRPAPAPGSPRANSSTPTPGSTSCPTTTSTAWSALPPPRPRRGARRPSTIAARPTSGRVPGLPSNTGASWRRHLRIGGRDWRVIVGYGHSPEHASLYCAELEVLISGDMLLPRISTNVSAMSLHPGRRPARLVPRFDRAPSPIARNTWCCPRTGALPRHPRPRRPARRAPRRAFRGAARRLYTGRSSACELIPTLFKRELDAHQIMFAMGEAIAHLNYLEHKGRGVRSQE